jgi:hypothetical protein
MRKRRGLVRAGLSVEDEYPKPQNIDGICVNKLLFKAQKKVYLI